MAAKKKEPPKPTAAQLKIEKMKRKEAERVAALEKCYRQFQYVPATYDQLRGIVLSYISNFKPAFPIHSEELFQKIYHLLEQCSSSKNIDKLKELKFLLVLKELHEEKAVTLGKRCLGSKMIDLIEDIDRAQADRLYDKYRKLIPANLTVNELINSSSKSEFVERNYEANSILEQIILQKYNQQHQMKFKHEIKPELLKRFEQEASQAGILLCPNATKDNCRRLSNKICKYAHLEKREGKSATVCPSTKCANKDCELGHYELVQNVPVQIKKHVPLFGKQWINCDLRKLDMKVLGKFDVVMADPPWDIHMTLPYSTMKDKEMKNLCVEELQSQGFIFLWVTGRAMELGRECLIKWGYRRVEEIIWVKTQQNAIIRSGRTGHWLNHTKEHCLVGLKGEPPFNRNLDCDVLVSKVRETSRKPDQIYGIIERLAPCGRFVQLFGRPHNTRKGWLTLGNQLPGSYIEDQKLLARYKEAYPTEDLSREQMVKNLEKLNTQQQFNDVYNSHIQTKKAE